MTAVRAPMRALLVAGTVSLAAGCAASRNAAGENSRSDILTQEEIMNVQGARNLHDVVQRVRPRWLTVRAENRSLGGQQAQILVYQDQSRLGDVEMLRQMDPTFAREMRYLDGPKATATLPGIGAGTHVAGAIIVITRSPEN